MLNATVAAALLAGASAPGPRVIENRGQALPKGAMKAASGGRRERKDRDRAAAMDLQRISNQTLVVAHLHPRWLRRAVEEAMDLGAVVTHRDVDAIRAADPDTWRDAVGFEFKSRVFTGG